MLDDGVLCPKLIWPLTLKTAGGGLIQPIECRYGVYAFNFHQNFSNFFLLKAVGFQLSPKKFLGSWGFKILIKTKSVESLAETGPSLPKGMLICFVDNWTKLINKWKWHLNMSVTKKNWRRNNTQKSPPNFDEQTRNECKTKYIELTQYNKKIAPKLWWINCPDGRPPGRMANLGRSAGQDPPRDNYIWRWCIRVIIRLHGHYSYDSYIHTSTLCYTLLIK